MHNHGVMPFWVRRIPAMVDEKGAESYSEFPIPFCISDKFFHISIESNWIELIVVHPKLNYHTPHYYFGSKKKRKKIEKIQSLVIMIMIMWLHSTHSSFNHGQSILLYLYRLSFTFMPIEPLEAIEWVRFEKRNSAKIPKKILENYLFAVIGEPMMNANNQKKKKKQTRIDTKTIYNGSK